MTTPKCQLYLISPLDVGGDFPAKLEEALSAAPVREVLFDEIGRWARTYVV